MPEAALITPALITVNQPRRREGAEAVGLLLDVHDTATVELSTDLVVRAVAAPLERSPRWIACRASP